MQKWHLNGMDCWLCDDCSRQNGHMVLRHGWAWQEEVKDSGLICDNCRCTDSMVERHGRLRWLYCWITMLMPWITNRRRHALRRAK